MAQDTMKFFHRPDHVADMFNHMDRPQFVKTGIAKRIWMAVEISNNVGRRAWVVVESNGAGILSDPAPNV